jgi:hypothetical protein
LRALITREEADGTTETAAWRFWIVSFTVTRRPFYHQIVSDVCSISTSADMHTQSPVAFAISSPTFFGDNPRGPILGARADEAPTSPPVARRWLIVLLAENRSIHTSRMLVALLLRRGVKYRW